MVQVLENAAGSSKAPTSKAGQNTKQMRAWRAMGTALLDTSVLVFNLVRTDYRERHLAAYAKKVQTSLSGVPWERAFEDSVSRVDSIRVLMEMAAIVRIVQQLASAHEWVLRDCYWSKTKNPNDCQSSTAHTRHADFVTIGRTTLWVTLKTFLAHRCWRHFPATTVRLPVVPNDLPFLVFVFLSCPQYTHEWKSLQSVPNASQLIVS